MQNFSGITTVLITATPADFNKRAYGAIVGSFTEAIDLCTDLRNSGYFQPITVYVAPGEYELVEELLFTPEIFSVSFESLSNNANDVIISGAKLKAAQKAEFCGKECLSVSVPKGVTDLYVGKSRVYPTRFPENGYLEFAGAENEGIMLDDTSKWVKLNTEDVKELSKDDIEGATLNFLHYWVDEHAAVKSYDEKTGKLIIKEYSRFGIYGEKTKAVYYLANVKKLFGQKGRCFFDGKAKKAYYVPDNKWQQDGEVRVPHLRRLVSIKGTPKRKVENLTFKNITFAFTRGDRKIVQEDGRLVASDGQAAWSAGGVFEMEYAKNCRLIGCKFINYGLYGLCVSDGCEHITVESSVFMHGGAGGIKISGADVSGKKNAHTHSIEITNCEIADCGEKYLAGCGILIGHAYNNSITHNEIHDLYYSGISVGWVWGYKESVTQNNYIAHNKIYNIGKGVLSDMGGVYLLGAQRGTTVYNNLIYNVQVREYGGWAIYIDEGGSFITVENNVCYDCFENCFHQHYGKMNVIKNNLFAKAGAELCRITRAEEHLSAVFERNALVAENSAVYGFPSEEFIKKGCVKTGNNAICASDMAVIAGNNKYGFKKAQKLGLEINSVLADGVFEIFYDKKAGISGKEILKSGYVPIDLKSVGKLK